MVPSKEVGGGKRYNLGGFKSEVSTFFQSRIVNILGFMDNVVSVVVFNSATAA